MDFGSFTVLWRFRWARGKKSQLRNPAFSRKTALRPFEDLSFGSIESLLMYFSSFGTLLWIFFWLFAPEVSSYSSILALPFSYTVTLYFYSRPRSHSVPGTFSTLAGAYSPKAFSIFSTYGWLYRNSSFGFIHYGTFCMWPWSVSFIFGFLGFCLNPVGSFSSLQGFPLYPTCA